VYVIRSHRSAVVYEKECVSPVDRHQHDRHEALSSKCGPCVQYEIRVPDIETTMAPRRTSTCPWLQYLYSWHWNRKRTAYIFYHGEIVTA